jgi:hypothetical protein
MNSVFIHPDYFIFIHDFHDSMKFDLLFLIMLILQYIPFLFLSLKAIAGGSSS